MHDQTRRRHALLLTLLALTLLAPQATAEATPSTLQTPDTIEYAGTTNLTADDATLHARTHQATLTAQNLHIHTHWEKGHQTTTPLAKDPTIIQERGHDHHNTTQTTLTFTPLNANPEILALPNPNTLTAQSQHESHQHALPQDALITRQGYSNDTQNIPQGDPPGFEHTIPTPQPAHRDLDEATLTGDFTLHVNNVTLHIDPDNQPAFDTWTGETTHDDEPATEYELRVTQLHAQNATLHIQHANRITITAPTLTTHHQGALQLTQTTGLLHTPSQALQLENDPLLLEGSGTLQTTHHQQRLTLTIDGTYQPLLTPTPTPTTPTLPTLPTLLLGTILAIGTLTHRYPKPLRFLPQPHHQRLYDHWEIKGHKNREANPRKAIRCYERLIHLNPQIVNGWQGKARILTQKDPNKALRTIQDAKDTIDRDQPLVLLETEIFAAFLTGQHDHAKERFLTFLERDPKGARCFLEHYALPTLLHDPDIHHALQPNDGHDERGSLGYA